MSTLPETTVEIRVFLDRKLRERIDRVVKKYGVNRSSFVESMIVAGIDAFELAEDLGMVRIAEMEKSVRGRIKNVFTNLKYVPGEVNKC